jgi:hypothetical protein
LKKISKSIKFGVLNNWFISNICASQTTPRGLKRIVLTRQEPSECEEFAETNFGGDFADKYGVNYLTTADEYRTQKGIEYNPQTGDLQSKTSVVDGATLYNNSTNNPMSDVYISKGAFISPSRLFSVVGHEFVHSSHYKMGLFEAMIKQFGEANGTKLFYRYSEASAYSFTLASANSMGNISYANFIRNNTGSNYNFQTVTIFGWRRLGLPLQVK